MNSAPIGFDRCIKLEWLDATATGVAEGLSPDEIRARLTAVLEGQVAGTAFNSAMGKTKTVLMRIWALVPDRLAPLRDAGLRLLPEADPGERLAIHWGMCLASYPFFCGVAEQVGRLVQLQGGLTMPELTKRLRETWGERSTLDRAAQRIVQTMIDWGVLTVGGQSGELRADAAPPIAAVCGPRGGWLLAAAAFATRENTVPLARLRRSPAMFPFEVSATVEQIEAVGGLSVVRVGVDGEVVAVA